MPDAAPQQEPAAQSQSPPSTPAPAAAPAAKPEPKVVPLAALQKEREKRQALEAQLDELKKKGAATPDALLESDDFAHDPAARKTAMEAREARLRDEMRKEMEEYAEARAEEVASTKLTQYQLDLERSRYAVFAEGDEDVQRTANLFLRDNLEQGMNLKEAVKDAARRAQRYAGKGDVDLEETPGGNKTKQQLPPERKPSGSLAVAAVEVENPEVKELGKLEPNARAEAAQGLWKKLLGKK